MQASRVGKNNTFPILSYTRVFELLIQITSGPIVFRPAEVYYSHNRDMVSKLC